jgi:CheY-like chemotaxis protein
VIEPLLVRPQATLDVLVVDDDELIHSAMQTLIQALGHKATTVASGEEALARLEAGFTPDVVILDMNMPGLGGVGTLPRLRALRPQTPVVIATGRVDQATLDLIAVHPFTTLMPKPFSLDQLRKRLELLLLKGETGAVHGRSRRAGGERRRANSEFHASAPGHPWAQGYQGFERRSDPGAGRRRP